MDFNYSSDKNAKLGLERNIDFEEIVNAIKAGNIICIEKHHNQVRYPDQKIMHVRLKDEVYSVPFIEESKGVFFLKTVYASRKARKKFLETKKK